MPFLNPEALDKVQDALMSLDPIKAAIAMALVTSARDAIAPRDLREAANDKYGTDDIEIDDEPGTAAADGGTWVAAWVWIAAPDDDGECETCAQAIETRNAPCDECGHMDVED